MRRNALSLLLAILVSSTGCQLLGKKKAENWRAPEGIFASAGASIQEQIPAVIDPFEYSTEAIASPADFAMVTSFPPPAIAEPRYHVVAAKDTLYSLARVYYADQRRWKEIYVANASIIGRNPDRIFVGQRLLIP